MKDREICPSCSLTIEECEGNDMCIYFRMFGNDIEFEDDDDSNGYNDLDEEE